MPSANYYSKIQNGKILNGKNTESEPDSDSDRNVAKTVILRISQYFDAVTSVSAKYSAG